MKALPCATAILILIATCGVASAQAVNNLPLPPVVPDYVDTTVANAVSLAQQQAAIGSQVVQNVNPGALVPAQPNYLPLIPPFVQ